MTDTPHNIPVGLGALTEETTPISTDTLYMVDNPGGTPISKKVTFANASKGFDHGSIGGLSDDDHTQYLLASGTRALTGSMIINDNVKLLIGTGSDAEIYYNGTDLYIDPDAVGSGVVQFGADVKLLADSRKIHFGAGSDYSIYWNGSALRFDAASSGTVRFSHEVNAVGGFKDAGVSGIDATRSWDDGGGAGATHSVTIGGGIITAWTVT